MTIRDVSKSKAVDTAYSEFSIKHSQRVALNSAETYDYDLGRSPVSRWIARAFDYSDFASNPNAHGYRCPIRVPRGSRVLRVMAEVHTVFNQMTSDVDVGTGGTPWANPGDGWGDGLDLTATGLKYDPDADFNPGGSTGPQSYMNGDTIDMYISTTPPTAGQGVLYIEVISYHEQYAAEW